MRTRIGMCAVAGIVVISTWTALASWLFVWMAGLFEYFPLPLVTWWQYTQQSPLAGSTLFYLIASGLIAGLPSLPLILVVARKKLWRQPRPFPNVHGSARWAGEADIRHAGLIGHGDGVYIGAWKNPRTGKTHYLRDKSGAHVAGIAPTRSGKGLGWVLPNLLSWRDSLFIYDPKGELWQLTAGWRKAIGQNVLRWQPGDPLVSCGFNFLDEVRLGTEYETADAQNIAVMLIDQEGSGFTNHWDRAAFGFLTGLILHCLHVARDTGTVTSLPLLTMLLSSPKVEPMLLCKHMAGSKYGAAITAAGTDQINRDDRERGAVLSTVKTYLSLFLDPIVAKNCSRSSFRIQDLMDHKQPTSLYVMVPGADGARLRPLVRLLITMILNQLVSVPVAFDTAQQPMQTHKHKMLLMMEEFPDLRRLKMFEAAMAVMAGAGITAFLIMQDREQLLGAYGQHQTIMANVHLTGAYAPNEGKTADWLSHELGNRTLNLEQFSTSGKRGRWLSNLSRSFSPISRPLLTPDEVRRLPGVVKDGSRVVGPGQMLILPTGQRPILGQTILYFEDPAFLERSQILPPAAGDDLELIRRFKTVA